MISRKKLLFCAALLSFSSSSFLVKGAALAAESVCFTQPSGQVPVACPAKADGTPVVSSGSSVAASSDTSTTITTGGTFQTIAAASTTRQSLEFTNICNQAAACTNITDLCYLFIAASGTPTIGVNVIAIPPGSSYLRNVGTIPSDAIQATCASNGDHFKLVVQ